MATPAAPSRGPSQNTTGTIALTKTGTGTLALGGSDTYSGGTTLSAGQLNLNNASAIGSGPLTISGGTIGNTSGAAITLSTNNAQNWNGDFTFAGSNDLNLGGGAVTMSSSRTVTVASGNLTVAGVISDGSNGYSLTKAGTGTLTLAGADTYSGPTTVSGGTLQIGAGGAAGSINNTSGVTDNATLAFNRSDKSNLSVAISGNGDVAMLRQRRARSSSLERLGQQQHNGRRRHPAIGQRRRARIEQRRRDHFQRRPRPARLRPWRGRPLQHGDYRQPFRRRRVYADRRQRQRQRHVLGNHRRARPARSH